MLACANTPRDGMADGTGTDNHYYFSHTFPSFFVGDAC
jgi:hypothetical protein